MKKMMAVLMTLVLMIGAVALAESADYLGTWYLNGMNMAGAEIAPAALGMEMTMEVRDDGTATLAVPGEEGAEQAATWKLDGDAFIVTVEGEDMTLALQEDGSLVGEQGGLGMTFGREKIEAELYQPAPVVAAASEADFAGKWQPKYMEMNGQYMEAAIFPLDLTVVFDGANMTLNGMFVFEDATFTATFENGAMVRQGGDDEMYSRITAQLLEDGMMQLTLATGDEPLILILEKAA